MLETQFVLYLKPVLKTVIQNIMNLRIFALLIVTSLFISLFSCSSKPNRSRKPAVSIQVESANPKIRFGDDINFTFSVKLKDGDLKETRVFLDSVQLTSNTNADFSYPLKNFRKIGKHTLTVKSIKSDGVEGVYYKSFEVFSDVVPEQFSYEVVQTYPHNQTAFTEGLEIHDGFLYESTGENKTSFVYKNNLKTGKTLQSVKLADKYFGEGLTILNGKIFQLTYKNKIGFVYKLENMALIDSFRFESAEGWGMTNDKQNLIMSDGTNYLTWVDPTNYSTVKKIQVYDHQSPVQFINELEYSDGIIFANIWGKNMIVKIDAETGKVLATVDLSGILSVLNTDKVDVLNGIAIDPATKKMYVTGKYYPKLFEIRLVKKG